jgi:hypothetical protein
MLKATAFQDAAHEQRPRRALNPIFGRFAGMHGAHPLWVNIRLHNEA